MSDAPVPYEANHWHLEALVGGNTRWRERIEQVRVLDVRWDKLPLAVRRMWWRETDYSRRPASPEFMAQLPQLLADEQAKVEAIKCEIADATARACVLLSEARQLPCKQCLRPASPYRERCLRSMLWG